MRVSFYTYFKTSSIDGNKSEIIRSVSPDIGAGTTMLLVGHHST
jgi:hypothetical protein